MTIPREIIDRILHETDIVELISQTVPLKKTGANYKACCPFHNEKTASFVVSPQKQIYHCFGCGAGGNALGFLMAHEKIDFIEAVKELAGRLNIVLPKTTTRANDEDPRDALLKINSYAQWFFCEAIKKAKHAQEYLAKRGLVAATIERYALGYAPDGFEALLNYLTDKKIPLDLAVKLGVIKRRDDGKAYDFYRDRLMFPIRNVRGHVIGFSGRTLSNKDEAKYINSVESPVYNKGREVFGLFEAKDAIKRADQIVLVEGNVDVLAASQLGVENVVAPLGTSLTESQVKLLKRYSQNIVIMFDGDDAGQKACLRAVEICFAAENHPKVVLLPKGKDPGDFLVDRDHSPSLKEFIAQATDAFDWIFSAFASKATEQPRAKADALRGLITWIRRLPDPLERIEYEKKASQYFDVTLDNIQKNQKTLEITKESAMTAPLAGGQASLESHLISLYVQQPEAFKNNEFDEILANCQDEKLKLVGEWVKKYLEKHETFDAAVAITEVPEDLKGLLSEISMQGDDEKIAGWGVEDCKRKLKIQVNKKQLKDITARILKADLAHDEKEKIRLLREKQELLREAQGLVKAVD
jgi:DNA primase